jgi:hypothetical protein
MSEDAEGVTEMGTWQRNWKLTGWVEQLCLLALLSENEELVNAPPKTNIITMNLPQYNRMTFMV